MLSADSYGTLRYMRNATETEVWFRNPDSYIRELAEVGADAARIAWDRGLVHKKRIDVKAHAALHFGQNVPYRLLLVGEQGTAEIRNDSTFEKPTAVYPTWCYGEEQSLLEEIVRSPVAEDAAFCLDRTVPADERPVWGQEHRVVITDLPDFRAGPGRKFLRYLKELQEEYPKAILHIHGMWMHKMAFGMGFGSADVSPRESAQKGRIVFPSGREEKFEAAFKNPQWVTVLGFKPVDLEIPRNRCIYNIKSALWAGKHYNSIFNFQVRNNGAPVDTTSSDDDFKPITTKSHMSGKAVAKVGDKQMCDTCSLTAQCKYFRDGAVCTVPGADNKKLAEYFNSRNADRIIDGLGTLVAASTRRLERGIQDEEAFGETSPEVTKMLNQVFTQGVALAKLIDPSLSGSRVQVNVGVGQGGAAMVATANPQQMVAAIFRQLEAEGIARKDITDEMIQGLLAGMAQPDLQAKAIQGVVTSRHDEE